MSQSNKGKGKATTNTTKRAIRKVTSLSTALINTFMVNVNPFESFFNYLAYSAQVLFTLTVLAPFFLGTNTILALSAGLQIIVPLVVLGFAGILLTPLWLTLSKINPKNPLLRGLYEVVLIVTVAAPWALPWFWVGKFISIALINASSLIQLSASTSTTVGGLTLPFPPLTIGITYELIALGIAGLIAGPVAGLIRRAAGSFGALMYISGSFAFLLGMMIGIPIALITVIILVLYDTVTSLVQHFSFTCLFNLSCINAALNLLNPANWISTFISVLSSALTSLALVNGLVFALIVADLLSSSTGKILKRRRVIASWSLYTIAVAFSGFPSPLNVIVPGVLIVIITALVYVLTYDLSQIWRGLVWLVALPGLAYAFGAYTCLLVTSTNVASVALLTVVQAIMLVGLIVIGGLIAMLLGGISAIAGIFGNIVMFLILGIVGIIYTSVAAAVINSIVSSALAAIVHGTALQYLTSPYVCH